MVIGSKFIRKIIILNKKNLINQIVCILSSDEAQLSSSSPAGRSSPTTPKITKSHSLSRSTMILSTNKTNDDEPIVLPTVNTNKPTNEFLKKEKLKMPFNISSTITNNKIIAHKNHNIKSTTLPFTTTSSSIPILDSVKNKNMGGVVANAGGDNQYEKGDVVVGSLVARNKLKYENNINSATSKDTLKKYNPVYVQKTLITQPSECNNDNVGTSVTTTTNATDITTATTTTTTANSTFSNILKFVDFDGVNYENIDLQKTMMTSMRNQLFDKNQIHDDGDEKETNKYEEDDYQNMEITTKEVKNDGDNNDDDEDEDNAFEYTDDDINAALEKVDDIDDEDNDPKTPINEDNHECHYLPMTPKKINISDSNSQLELKMKTEENEENTYVEMTQGKYEKSVLADDYDVSSSNYEPMIINAQNKMTSVDQEPVYMELSEGSRNNDNYSDITNLLNNGKSTIKKSTLKKYSEKKAEKMSNLPDILCDGKAINDSDHDDDDDGSHHNKKSRKRFSLSDTFRPASYYLGNRTPLQEIIDSSDSEIVSPPPIPSSAPPIDDIIGDQFDTIKRSQIRESITHSSNPVLSMNKNEGTNSSRLSLPEQLNKYKNKRSSFENEYLQKYKTDNKMYSAESNYSLTTDDGSLTSSDYDVFNKIKLQSPSFSDIVINQSDQFKLSGAESESESVQIRSPLNSTLLDNLERKKRRRPLSEDSFSEIESTGSNFTEAINSSDLDQYLNNLQCNSISPNYEQSSASIIDEIHYVKPPKVFCNDEDDPPQTEIRSLTLDDLMRSESHLSSAMFDSIYDNDTSSKLSTCISVSSLKPIEENSPNSDYGFIPKISHTRDNSNLSESSLAPYYYSDIASRNSSNNDVSNINKIDTIKLNNERDIGQNRNKGISHIHNPINKKNENQYKSDKSSGRSLSMEILNVGEKDINIGSRNLYEENNLLKPANNKIYYAEKNNRGYDMKYYNDSMQLSASLAVENMIYNQTLPPPPPPPSVMMTSNMTLPPPLPLQIQQQQITSVASSDICASDIADNDDQSSSGDHLWEEDRMWRESLRRVSLRHARSLDDLSRGLNPPSPSVTSSKIAEADKKWGISTSASKQPEKMSPSSTYENQTFHIRNPHQITRRHHQKSENDNDVYVQLAQPPTSSSTPPPPVPPHHNFDTLSDVYEVLREDNTVNDQLSSTRYLDREKIRQWDSMSSGLISSPTLTTKNEMDKYKMSKRSTSPTTSTSSSMSGPTVRHGPIKKPMRLTLK